MPGKKNKTPSPSPKVSKKKRKPQQLQPMTRPATMAKASLGIMQRANAASTAEEKLYAMAMGLPSEVGAVRFPTVDAPRTAVMSTLDQRTVITSAVAPTHASGSSVFNPGDLVVAYYGQPGRLAMIWSTFSSPSYYMCLFSTAYGVSQDWTLTPSAIGGQIENNTPWPLAATAVGTFSAVHGKTMAVGVSAGVSYVFMNTGDKFTIMSPTGTSTMVGTMGLELHQWTGIETSALVSTASVTLVSGLPPAGVDVFSIPRPGYYRVDFGGFYPTSGSTTTAITMQLRLSLVATDGWTQISMGDLDPNNKGDPSVGEEVRVNACSMLLTNTTSIMNRQGTVLAARIRSADFTDVSPTLLSRVAEKYTGDAALGVYTFKEFSDYAERFRNVVISDNTKGVVFDLDVDDFLHFVQITCPGVALYPNTYTVTFATTLEFKTDISRYQKDVARGSHMSLIAARRLINSRPEWFYENPVHASQIYDFIKSLGRKALTGAAYAAPFVAKAASAYNPAGAPGYEALAQMLRGLVLR